MKKAVSVIAASLLVGSGAALGEDAHPIIDGDPERGEDLAQACIACHGEVGNSDDPEWPNLAGQNARYHFEQLQAFQEGEHRYNAQMEGQVAGLSEQDMKDLAVYYEQQEHEVMGAGDDREELVERGEQIYMGGIPQEGVAACIACHGPRGEGNPAAGYPVVGGQWAAYLREQLHDYRDGERSTDREEMMRSLAKDMSDEDIEAVAEYMAGLH